MVVTTEFADQADRNAVREANSKRKREDKHRYGWITEGLETADFKKAKALLDELA
jgi:hypothetical protein